MQILFTLARIPSTISEPFEAQDSMTSNLIDKLRKDKSIPSLDAEERALWRFASVGSTEPSIQSKPDGFELRHQDASESPDDIMPELTCLRPELIALSSRLRCRRRG